MSDKRHNEWYNELTDYIRQIYSGENEIPLHRPLFNEDDERAVSDCVKSSFVSSVGPAVSEFEKQLADYCGSPYAVAVANGTSALHLALHCAGITQGDLVITQSLTFAATGHAILQSGAEPVYIDIKKPDAGINPDKLSEFLKQECILKDGVTRHKLSGKRIHACVPMHTFGIPSDIKRIIETCDQWNIQVIEDAAEALGSRIPEGHCGTFGKAGIISFNGNKIITTGSGGAVLCKEKSFAERLKHVSTTAKKPHHYEFIHDELGFNYRLSNLNAALGLSQLKKLPEYLQAKAAVNTAYRELLSSLDLPLLGSDTPGSNHWLNTLLCDSFEQRETLLAHLFEHKISARPAWYPLHKQPHLASPVVTDLTQTEHLYQRAISLPSSVPLNTRQSGA